MFTANKMKKGFTLIELMVSVSIFVVVMTISMGSIIGVFDANRKSRSLKTVLNNLNIAVESVSKEMRYGTNYHCEGSATGPNDPITSPQDCPYPGGNLISFLSSDDVQITYRINGSSIEKQVGSGGFIALTAPEIIIDNLTFYTFGTTVGDTSQPKVIIKIDGHSGTTKGRSDFTLQTLVSQRALDLAL